MSNHHSPQKVLRIPVTVLRYLMLTPAKTKRNSQTVLLITNVPTPYRIPLFNELRNKLLSENFRLFVVFSTVGYSHRKWRIDLNDCEFDYTILSGVKLSFRSKERTTFTYPGLLKCISQVNPTVIISNAFSIATTKIYLLHKFGFAPPYIIWSGAIESTLNPDSHLRKWQRKQLVKDAARYISYGSLAKNYFIKLGADSEKVYIGINTVDTSYFMTQTKKLRSKAGSFEANEFLVITYLVIRKQIDLLFEVVAKLAESRNDFVLRIVGDGPERGNLERLTAELDIGSVVSFEGYRQKSELPTYLARAKCFLFPTAHDIWGLTLVEAMSAGLPCLASINAGATADLINDGHTGFSLDFSNTQSVVARLEWILDHPEEAKDIGLRAQKFVSKNATVSISACGFIDAIRSYAGDRNFHRRNKFLG